MSEQINIDESAIKTIGALTAAAAAVQHIGSSMHLVIPEAFKHIEITALVEKAWPTPSRKRGTVHLGSIDSFNRVVSDQGAQDVSMIYADPDARTLTAVFNDHATHDDQAGWRDHRAVFNAELSREFSGWLGKNNTQMDQESFAIFLEDNIADIVEPSGDVLLAVALTLQAKTEVAFSSHKRLDNGQIAFGYSEAISATAGGNGEIVIPREFSIGLRIFKHGEGYKVKARLKYRLNSGKLKFWFELDRVENVIEEAFAAYIHDAAESGFTVLIGKP